MDLVHCTAPAGRIEPAPLTCLVPDAEPASAWGAFWGEDDAYYVRRTQDDGAVRWFQVAADAGVARSAGGPALTAMPELAGTPAGSAGAGRRVVFLFRAGARGGRVTSLAIRVGPSRRRR